MAKVPLYGGTNNHAWVVDRPGVGMPGNVWFVDSGAGGGADDAAHGKTMAAPFVTLDYAIGRCTASQGDIIYLLPGHAETIAAGASSPTLDVAGITVVGIGDGAARPTFTFTHVDAHILMSAANCRIENVLLVCGVNGETDVLFVSATNCTIENCEFRQTAALVPAIYLDVSFGVGHGGDYTTVRGCRFYSTGAVTAEAVRAATQDFVVVDRCLVAGQFTAGIDLNGAGLMVRDNLCDTTDAGGTQGWTLTGTGVVVGNRAVSRMLPTFPCTAVGLYSWDNLEVAAINTSGYVWPTTAGSQAFPIGYVEGDSLSVAAGEKTADGVVVTRATAALPQSTVVNLFDITGGRVLLKRFVGNVTTNIGAVANVTHIHLNPDGAGATTDLCLDVGGLDVNGDVAGTIYTITGTFTDAMVATTDIPAVSSAYEIVLPPGKIVLDCAASDGGGGRVKWSVTYVPLEDGAYIAAV